MLTTAELGPGISPLVSGVSDRRRLISSENSGPPGVAKDGPGRDWLRASTVLSSVIVSHVCYEKSKECWFSPSARV